MDISSLILALSRAITVLIGLYLAFILLLTVPFFQDQIIYLHSVTLTWFQDVSVPEQWGFLRNQVTPFQLKTPDGETLHAWHILPLGFYLEHEQELVKEPTGNAPDVTQTVAFQLLRDDPEARLVLYLHGAAGTLGSGWRPPSYRAMYAGSPDKIHVLAVDYRGFGTSTGRPSEQGLLTDAVTLAEFAIHEAGISPSRIAIFGQSLGTAVGISLAHHMAARPEPVLFSGMVLVAPFADVELLTATYRVAGVIPILDPLSHFPGVLTLLNTFIVSKWPSKDKLAEFIRRVEGLSSRDSRYPEYHVNIIHAQDDYDIPWSHSEQVFWHAVDASRARAGDEKAGISFEDLEKEKEASKQRLGAGAWTVTCKTDKGLIREDIVQYGLHDKVMSYPVVSLAIVRALHLHSTL